MHERRLTGPHAISTSSLPSAPFHENIGVTPHRPCARARGSVMCEASLPPPGALAGYMHICMY
eukprot:scaffold34145_cov36-Phaeocystis_antarctica.AAC.1